MRLRQWGVRSVERKEDRSIVTFEGSLHGYCPQLASIDCESCFGGCWDGHMAAIKAVLYGSWFRELMYRIYEFCSFPYYHSRQYKLPLGSLDYSSAFFY